MTPLARGRGRVGPPAPFVVGVGRSGTTLLRLMLDAHPELAIPAETHFVPDLLEAGARGTGAEQLCDLIVGARNWGDFALEEEALRERIAALPDSGPAHVLRAFYSLYSERQGKSRWGDKTPGYVKDMRTIAKALPESRFVHLIRDGRDVALSRRRRGMGAGKPLAETAGLWRRRIELARHQAKRLRGRYLELRYEDLVTETEPRLRTVCEFCELDYDPAMLRFHERAAGRLAEMSGDLPPEGGRLARSGEERVASHALATGPPTEGRMGAWRTEMSAGQRAEFEGVAADLLRDLGYET